MKRKEMNMENRLTSTFPRFWKTQKFSTRSNLPTVASRITSNLGEPSRARILKN
jgi:hypothetical protein